MKVLIATEYRIIEDGNKYYVDSNLYTIIQRYYNAFGKLFLYTRVVNQKKEDRQQDITQYVSKIFPEHLIDALLYRSFSNLKEIMRNMDLVVGRFDSIIACRAASCAKLLNKPFFAELMADAWDGYWNHGIKGKLLAPYMYFETRRAVRKADYALYVTEKHLQKRYPCKCESINASNVKIDEVLESSLETRINKIKASDLTNITLMTVGAVDVLAKGQQYVIKAIPKLKELGINVTYYLVGGGNTSYLKRLSNSLNVSNQVVFWGERPHSEVMELMKVIDLYIQPSLQEGLPRSVIEAMSVACPCLGARTAGTPELLDSSCIFTRKSSKSIVKAVQAICLKEELIRQAKRNFCESEKYLNNILDERRNTYYEKIKMNISKGFA